MATKVTKTKVGSEYRVRGPEGKLKGEFNKPAAAGKRAAKATKRKKK